DLLLDDWQLGDGGLQRLAQLATLERLVGTGERRGHGVPVTGPAVSVVEEALRFDGRPTLGNLVGDQSRYGHLAPCGAHVGAGDVDEDSVQPGAERRASLEPVYRLERRQPGGLHHLGGGGRVAHPDTGDAKEA